jgi:hypothetical protein
VIQHSSVNSHQSSLTTFDSSLVTHRIPHTSSAQQRPPGIRLLLNRAALGPVQTQASVSVQTCLAIKHLCFELAAQTEILLTHFAQEKSLIDASPQI